MVRFAPNKNYHDAVIVSMSFLKTTVLAKGNLRYSTGQNTKKCADFFYAVKWPRTFVLVTLVDNSPKMNPIKCGVIQWKFEVKGHENMIFGLLAISSLRK